MKKDFGVKTALYPQPVTLISTYNDDGSVDVMNAAWVGVSDFDKINLCLSKDHATVKNILKRKGLVINIADVKHVKEADYFGLVSANTHKDKFIKSGLTVTKSSLVDAPLINELNLAIECELLNYNKESEIMSVKILNVKIDESVLDKTGHLDVKKLDPITFDTLNGAYIRLGDKVADAFKIGKEIK